LFGVVFGALVFAPLGDLMLSVYTWNRRKLKAEGNEESGSQSYVPPDEKDDRALKEALDLLRGTITDAAFPPNSKAAVPN
jgi:hypothetical protein